MTAESTFRFQLPVPRIVTLEGRKTSREDFFEWIWREFTRFGLAGIHEGTLLSEQAAGEGLETESWTLDAGEAPRDRDWIDNQSSLHAELYFTSRKGAEGARSRIEKATGLKGAAIEEQVPEDWDAQWKASFLATPDGVEIPPYWRVVPPWTDPVTVAKSASEKVLKINPGAGFGTGTHETTQLCMEALAGVSRKPGFRVLDFGSGSGILSIAAAMVGGEVDAVEIDPLAIDNAIDNARLNQLEDRIHTMQYLDGAPGPYPVVIANILKPILLQFSDDLVSRMDLNTPGGPVLILSGLVEKDVEPVLGRYTQLLEARAPGKWKSRVLTRGEWRAIVFNAGP